MGRADSDLTEDGLLVARQLSRAIQGEGVDLAYCSPLGRARASADIYVAGLEIPLTTVESMAELSCGEWEGKPRAEVTQGAIPLRNTWDKRPPAGESYRDAEKRVSTFLETLRELPDTQTALVVGHAGVNRVFLRLWTGLEEDRAIRILCRHDTVYLLENGGQIHALNAQGVRTEGLLYEW